MKANPVKDRRAALVAAHKNNASRRPLDTLEALAAEIGPAAAVVAVAEAVNVSGSWDGRISKRSREWAAQVANGEDQTKAAQESRWNFYPDEIHPAHMDQLAAAAMEFNPAPVEEDAAQLAPAAPAVPDELAPVVEACEGQGLYLVGDLFVAPEIAGYTAPAGVPAPAAARQLLAMLAAAPARLVPDRQASPDEHISVSPGNRKMGPIPSLSLPYVSTCPVAAPCVKKCYARRHLGRCLKAYRKNYRIWATDPVRYWDEVRRQSGAAHWFRYSVSGDIPSMLYFLGMVDTALSNPGTRYMAFTKQYPFVNTYLAAVPSHSLPDNLQVIPSGWDEDTPAAARWELVNPFHLPTTGVIFEGQSEPAGAKVCGGNCFECCCKGIGCWELQRGEVLFFHEH